MKHTEGRVNKTVALIKYKHTIDSAKKRGKDFSLGLLYLANVLMQTRCAYSGEEFDDSVDGMISLERIHNHIGYVDGNVIPVKRGLNTLRGSKSMPDLLNELKQAENRMFELAKFANDEAKMVKNYQYTKKDIAFFQNKKEIKEIQHQKIKSISNNINKLEKLIPKRAKDSMQQLNEIKQLNDCKLKIGSCERIIISADKSIAERLETCAFTLVEAGSSDTFDKWQKRVKDLKALISGVSKFENLSRSEKTRVDLGLELGTPFTAVLKEKLIYNLLGGKL